MQAGTGQLRSLWGFSRELSADGSLVPLVDEPAFDATVPESPEEGSAPPRTTHPLWQSSPWQTARRTTTCNWYGFEQSAAGSVEAPLLSPGRGRAVPGRPPESEGRDYGHGYGAVILDRRADRHPRNAESGRDRCSRQVAVRAVAGRLVCAILPAVADADPECYPRCLRTQQACSVRPTLVVGGDGRRSVTRRELGLTL